MIYDVTIYFVDIDDDRKTDDVNVKEKMWVRIETIRKQFYFYMIKIIYNL